MLLEIQIGTRRFITLRPDKSRRSFTSSGKPDPWQKSVSHRKSERWKRNRNRTNGFFYFRKKFPVFSENFFMDADFFRLRNYSAAKFAFSCSGNNWVGICDTVQCCPILTGICDTIQSRWYSSVSEILGCLLNCPMMMILTGISDTYRTVDVILVGINDNLVPAELSSASDATYRCL